MPLSDGTLELNHLDGWQVKSGSAKVAQGLEVPTDGCSAQADRPWRLVRDDVKRAWIDGSFATVVTEPGMANFDHFLRSMQELDDMTRTEGVELISGSCRTVKARSVSATPSRTSASWVRSKRS